MTKEKAINELNDLKDYCKHTFGIRTLLPYLKSLDMAIEALKQESCEDAPDIRIGECEDVISRDDAKSFLYERLNRLNNDELYDIFSVIIDDMYNELPPVQPKSGWIPVSKRLPEEEFAFDRNGEWFIVGIDTPQGSYTYHYSKEYWDYFKCKELDCGKEWDGHTEEDVTRLLSLAQEPCSNAISREDALEIIAKTDITNGVKPVFTGKQVQALLNDLPSVQPVGRWIPVSERLPKPNQYDGSVAMYYLVQNEYGDMLVASYDSNGWRQIYHHDYLKDEVVAWMFLPKLYSLDDD